MDFNMKIDLKKIDIEKIKAFLKRKETILAILVLIFIICIIIVGNLLIEDYGEAVRKRDVVKASYESIISSDTNVESLTKKIEEATSENESISIGLEPLEQFDVNNLLNEIKKDTKVTWRDETKTFTLIHEVTETPNLKAYVVTIDGLTGTYDSIKGFISYINDHEREISIDRLSFSKNKQTGYMSGSVTLTFYMEKTEAT